MKKLILSVTAVAGLTMVSDAQQVIFQDNGNNSYDIAINGVPDRNQDLNLELLVGSGGTATIDVVTLLLSQTTAIVTSSIGTVQPAAGDITFAEGEISDNTFNHYDVPAGITDFQVLAWTGNFDSYAAAAASPLYDVYVGESPVLTTWWDNQGPAVGHPPALLDLDGYYPIALVSETLVPEPSTLAMATFGIGSMLVFGPRKFVRSSQ